MGRRKNRKMNVVRGYRDTIEYMIANDLMMFINSVFAVVDNDNSVDNCDISMFLKYIDTIIDLINYLLDLGIDKHVVDNIMYILLHHDTFIQLDISLFNYYCKTKH